MTISPKINLKKLNSFKTEAYNHGKESKYITYIPSYYSFGHIAEIAIASILGYINTQIPNNIRVTMSESLDRNDIDFQVNGKPIQLKSKYSYEMDRSDWNSLECGIFVVNYDLDITPFIKKLFDYLDLDFNMLSDKAKSRIQMFWNNYMAHYGILESKSIMSKKQRNKMQKGYIIPQVASIKPHNQNLTKEEKEREIIKQNFQESYKIFKEKGRYPKGFWNNVTKELFVDLFYYILSEKGILIQKEKEITLDLLNNCGLICAYKHVFGDLKIQPLREYFFKNEHEDVLEQVSTSKQQPINNEKKIAEPKKSDLSLFYKRGNPRYKLVSKILSEDMASIVSESYNISKEQWMNMPLSEVISIIEKTGEISKLICQRIQLDEQIKQVIQDIKKDH